jgi:hypothetical protein
VNRYQEALLRPRAFHHGLNMSVPLLHSCLDRITLTWPAA